MNIEEVLASYGIWAVAFGAALEGETVVIIGGLLVHRGTLALIATLAAASAGAFLADVLFFTIGRHFGSSGRVSRLRKHPAFQRALRSFERHPLLFIFAARFLYGLRTVSPLAIGTTDIRFSRYLVICACAAIVWAALFITVGYTVGQTIEALFGKVRSAEKVIIPAALIFLVIGFLLRHLVRRRVKAAG